MAKGNIYTFTLEKEEIEKVEVTRKNKETGEEETILKNKKGQKTNRVYCKKT